MSGRDPSHWGGSYGVPWGGLDGPIRIGGAPLVTTLVTASTVYSVAIPTLDSGIRPNFVQVMSGGVVPLPLMGRPSLSGESISYNQLPMLTNGYHMGPGRQIINVAGATHLALAGQVANWVLRVTPLSNRRIHMIGPPVIRGNATRQAVNTTPGNVAIPATQSSGSRPPLYVQVGLETPAALVGKPCLSADSTLLADLPILAQAYDGIVTLNTHGCTHVRLALLTGSGFARLWALENG